jgi:hypothetical protein
MDLAQIFILDLGWIFFVAWAVVLAAVAAIAFGPDVRALAAKQPSRNALPSR